jgi:DNA-binding NarL/FixJ family response regulator
MRDLGERTAVVLDRHPLWVDALSKVLEEEGVRVVMKTTTADHAVAAVQEFRPDVLVAGVTGGELDCVRRAKDSYPELKPIVMADVASAEAAESAFQAGASVYCAKTADREDLASAIRQAFLHSIYIATGPRERTAAMPVDSKIKAVASDLTRRELETLRLVAEGHSNAALAKKLWVTEQTVKFHLSNIYRKLDVSNRTEASRWAQLSGLLSQPAPTPAAATSAAA